MSDKTNARRVDSLHSRMRTLRRKQSARRLTALGSVCAVLAVVLVFLIAGEGKGHSAALPGLYAGASMLFENAGGYILAAILAFTAGVIITVIILRKRFADKKSKEKAEEEKNA